MAIVAVPLAVDDLVEGMELDADVFDGVGRVLVKAGAVVGEKHLRIFRMCGVDEVRVRREVPDESLRPDPELLRQRAEAEEHLRPRFRRHDLAHPASAALFAGCVERLVKRSKWTGGGTHASA